MEDAHIFHQFDDSSHSYLFGVFDGHGGPEVAKFCSQKMPLELKKLEEFAAGDFEKGLIEVFHRMDDMMRTPEGGAEIEKIRQSADKGKRFLSFCRRPCWPPSLGRTDELSLPFYSFHRRRH
jgi:hypothetical protein